LKPLASTLRSYVKDTLVSFDKAGIDLTIVALGNEIRHGMLWPVGYADVDVQPWLATVANFSNVATLWKAARAGVDDAIHAGVSKPQVMVSYILLDNLRDWLVPAALFLCPPGKKGSHSNPFHRFI
jgi:arabinogalactan endo-1,4-beta-galactosidase